MNKLEKASLTLAQSSKGNPVIAAATIMLFYLMFNMLEATVEKLIFGERFEHWLDPIFICVFIAYTAHAIYWCAAYNLASDRSGA